MNRGAPVGGYRERGMVLLLALMFLLLIAMVASTAMQTSILEFRMAGNHQFREEALHTARAVAVAIADDPDNFALQGPVGRVICDSVTAADICDAGQTVKLPPGLPPLAAGVLLSYRVERQGPLLLDGTPERAVQRHSSSAVAYASALFETRVVVDGQPVGLGRAEVVQGVAILTTRPNGGRWE